MSLRTSRPARRRSRIRSAALADKFRPWGMYELRRAYRVTYDIKANWKLVISNYSECLHCPIIHPGLQKLSHYMTGDNDPPTSTWLGGRMELRPEVGTMSRDGKLRRALAAGPRRRAATPRLLLRAAAEPAAQPASRLRDDAPAVAEGGRPDRDLVRMALSSARVRASWLRPGRRDRLLGRHQPRGLARVGVVAGRHRLARIPPGLLLAA